MKKFPIGVRVEVETTDKHRFVIMNCGSVKYLETYDFLGNKVCLQGFSTIKKCKQALEVHKIQDNGEVFNPLHPRWNELTR